MVVMVSSLVDFLTSTLPDAAARHPSPNAFPAGTKVLFTIRQGTFGSAAPPYPAKG
jgi:hypothetical protein